MFTLAHLSDIHLGPMPRTAARDLVGKRIFGYLNWHRGRKEVHRREVLDALAADLKERHPDHVAVTGDLVNIGLPSEFEAARAWLKSLGNPNDISVVPGNHDAYVKIDHDLGIGRWRDFMTPDAGHGLAYARNITGFPYVRIRGPVAMVGLSTAIPTRPFRASGRLDKVQLDALPGLLNTLRGQELFRIVLIHHPPLPGLAGHHRGLVNAGDFVMVLQKYGAELVLYGHNHDQALDILDTATGKAAVVGVPSASVARARRKSLARYNLFAISGSAPNWSCEMTGRGLLEPDGDIGEIGKTGLTGARVFTG